MLELREVNADYGKIRVLRGVSMTVKTGEIVTLIGANGSGKTTTLKVISGLLKPSAGAVSFLGRRLDPLPPRRSSAAESAGSLKDATSFPA